MARRRNTPRPGGRPGRRRKKPRPRPVTDAGPPDTVVAKFEEETRIDVARVMRYLSQDAGLMEAERLLARVLEQHPDELTVFKGAGAYRVTGDEESAFVHIGLHRIVEQRIISREMGRLSPDKPWHDAVHEAMETVAAELFGEETEETAAR